MPWIVYPYNPLRPVARGVRGGMMHHPKSAKRSMHFQPQSVPNMRVLFGWLRGWISKKSVHFLGPKGLPAPPQNPSWLKSWIRYIGAQPNCNHRVIYTPVHHVDSVENCGWSFGCSSYMNIIHCALLLCVRFVMMLAPSIKLRTNTSFLLFPSPAQVITLTEATSLTGVYWRETQSKMTTTSIPSVVNTSYSIVN